MQGKSVILEFVGDYQKNEDERSFEEILNVLRRNKRTISAQCLAEGTLHRLKEQYEDCLETAVPLKKQMSRTDQAIDWLVYSLYGLTDGEISVVEGHARKPEDAVK